MKPTIVMLLASSIMVVANAYTAPVVGLWQKIPVAGPDYKAVARPSYIFTEQKLAEKTVFSALQDNSAGYNVVCCVEVVNLVPLDLKAVLAKFKGDADFVSHLKGIKGAKFMFEAQPVDKKEWSPVMKTLVANEANPADLSPFSAPVISVKLGQKAVPASFKAGSTAVQLKSKTDDAKGVAHHEFTVGGRVVKFSEPVETAE
jgi:hypothetical protein